DVTNGAPRFFLGVTSPSTTSPYGVTRTVPGGTGTRINILPCDAPTINGEHSIDSTGIDPNTGLCRFNRLSEQEIQPQIERLNLFGRGTLQITPTLQAYLELGYFPTNTKAKGTP